MSDLVNEFANMLQAGQAANQAQRNHKLAELVRAWPDMGEEERRRIMAIVTTDLLTQAAADRGTRLQRIRRWLASWIYNLVPAFWARRRRKG